MDTSAGDLGRMFASEVAERSSVAELWVSTIRGSIHLWLLAKDMDANEERSLYRLLGVLDERFADVDFQLHILKPSNYTIPLHEVLPKNAEKLFPHAA